MVGFPAARITDMHVCPMVTGIVPHVGGPVSGPCAPTVLTGKLLQARIGDLCTCVGPPDVITMGAFTTIVCGSPASRMLDMTAHGGLIVMGEFTVLIGSAGAAAPPTMVEIFPGVKVQGTPQFVEATLRALAAIASTPSGARMLADLQATGKPVTIVETANGGSCDNFGPGATDGTGSGSTVHWNPNETTLYDGSEPWMNAPPAVILGHEMTHATHVARGEVDMTKVQNDHRPDPTDPTGYNHWYAEEVRTAGIDPYTDPASTPYSENTIRSEWDPPQPLRRYY